LRLQGAKVAAEEQALSDMLTGLGNRRALDIAIRKIISTGVSFGLMHIDLDYFKAVNDTLGHAAGDHVLRVVARVLSEETRIGDTLARVGGDEFVVVLPDLSDRVEMGQIADRIIENLSQPTAFEGKICRVSASIGMTISTDYVTVTADQMLNDADQALYASKHAGRGRAMHSTVRGPGSRKHDLRIG
ncbi:MAG: GGDEF domain-containing protein, partial [Paracoccaceae bacterium]|nr:GGDEF domain-containing protein [Paracoccaceae bacterium]